MCVSWTFSNVNIRIYNQEYVFTIKHMLRAASYVVVVVKVYVGTYLIVTIISYLQVNSLLLFSNHDTIAYIDGYINEIYDPSVFVPRLR